jgi:hypothetical protein
MKLSEPKVITWCAAVLLGAVGLLAHFVEIPFVSSIAFYLVLAGLGLLALANLVKGL